MRPSGAGNDVVFQVLQSQGGPAVRQLDEIPIGQLRVTLKGYPGDWRSDTDQSRGVAEPPRNRPLPENPAGVDLVSPDHFTIGDRPVHEVIASRQSRREFSGESLDLEELSFLLWCTQGVTHVSLDGEGQVAQSFRAAPSAGGRYPIETYLAVNRVVGVPNGVYRYLPDHHQLLLVRADEAVDERIRAACYGQPFVGGAAAVFIWAAVPYRTEWKYGYLSHRMIAMEAGHVCQNLYLAAEAIDAGACALLSYDQDKVDALLGVDGEEDPHD